MSGSSLTWYLVSPSFSVNLTSLLAVLGVWLILEGLMRNSEKAWPPFFGRSGQREASLEESNAEVEGWLPSHLQLVLSSLVSSVARELLLVVQMAGG